MSKYLLSVIASLLLFSCTIEKRLYRPGWRVELRNSVNSDKPASPAETAAVGEKGGPELRSTVLAETDGDLSATDDAKPIPVVAGGAPVWEEIPVSLKSNRMAAPRSERLRQSVLDEPEFRTTVKRPFIPQQWQVQKIQKESCGDSMYQGLILAFIIAGILLLILITGAIFALFTPYTILGYTLLAIVLVFLIICFIF